MTNPPHAAPGKPLSLPAKRALEEAEARRRAGSKSGEHEGANTEPRPPETAGPKGVEPTRYGDWERGGITYDF